MAKKTSKNDTKSKTGAKEKKSTGAKKVVRKKTDARTPAKTKSRAVARTNRGRFDLKKAIVEVLDSNPGLQLSPAQVRILVMRRHIPLGEVARLLQLLRAETPDKIVVAQRGALPAAPLSSFGAGVDLEDAVLAVLCEEPIRSMTADEVRSESTRYLGYTPVRADVVIALNSNPKVKSEGGGLYSGDCS